VHACKRAPVFALSVRGRNFEVAKERALRVEDSFGSILESLATCALSKSLSRVAEEFEELGRIARPGFAASSGR
jgi:hypothetical protein